MDELDLLMAEVSDLTEKVTKSLFTVMSEVLNQLGNALKAYVREITLGIEDIVTDMVLMISDLSYGYSADIHYALWSFYDWSSYVSADVVRLIDNITSGFNGLMPIFLLTVQEGLNNIEVTVS